MPLTLAVDGGGESALPITSSELWRWTWWSRLTSLLQLTMLSRTSTSSPELPWRASSCRPHSSAPACEHSFHAHRWTSLTAHGWVYQLLELSQQPLRIKCGQQWCRGWPIKGCCTPRHHRRRHRAASRCRNKQAPFVSSKEARATKGARSRRRSCCECIDRRGRRLRRRRVDSRASCEWLEWRILSSGGKELQRDQYRRGWRRGRSSSQACETSSRRHPSNSQSERQAASECIATLPCPL